MTTLLRGLVFAYRCSLGPLLTATFGASCRFQPSCSAYALDALRTHGAARGAWLTLRRVARCRPGGGHGWDPVPAPGARPLSSCSSHPRTSKAV